MQLRVGRKMRAKIVKKQNPTIPKTIGEIAPALMAA
jgi:hypothetical protein